MNTPSLGFDPSLGPGALRAALVWGSGLPGCPRTETAPGFVEDLLGRVRGAGESFLSAERKAAVRNMLRHGKYKPAGRSKPSSEYLLAAALKGEFPLVNGPVDVNNAVSLEWGYPASVFDAAKTGDELSLRRGSSGEAYVFNASGQTIDLEDLLCVCRRGDATESGGSPEWIPCGNPVKDAMETKVFEDARDIVAVIYAPTSEPREEVDRCAARFAELLRTHCQAAESGYRVVGGE